MSRLVDIDDERFWDILFDEACVEGEQAKRIEKELEKIIAFNLDDAVAELEYKKEQCEKDATYWSEHSWKDSEVYNEKDMCDRKAELLEEVISILRKRGRA